jgi:glycerol uptake facilitator-like aquaporin
VRCRRVRDGNERLRRTVLLRRRALAEFIGTALLLIAVVGSGIAAQRLSAPQTGLELLENAVATGAALAAIILAVGAVSGAHLNPAVSLVDAAFGGLSWRELPAYVAAQFAGACAGTVIANLMFSLPALQISQRQRSAPGLWLAEAVATFGLLLVIFGLARSRRSHLAPFAVGAYITGAYFFTASTSFANPAVTVARMFSDTFAGISPTSAPLFVAFQVVGAAVALVAIRALYPDYTDAQRTVIVPRETPS